jgi:hypothetical protein
MYTPIQHIMIDRNTINSRPNVPALFLVAWAYTAARGKEPFDVRTASRSVMENMSATA